MSRKPESTHDSDWRNLVREALSAEAVEASPALREKLNLKLAALAYEATTSSANETDHLSSSLSSQRSDAMTISLPEKQAVPSPDKPSAGWPWRRMVEYGVVLSIIGVLISLTMSPSQRARELARSTQAEYERKQAELEGTKVRDRAQSSSSVSKIVFDTEEPSAPIASPGAGSRSDGAESPLANMPSGTKPRTDFAGDSNFLVRELDSAGKPKLTTQEEITRTEPEKESRGDASSTLPLGVQPGEREMGFALRTRDTPIHGKVLIGGVARNNVQKQAGSDALPPVTLYNGQARYERGNLEREQESKQGYFELAPDDSKNAEQYDAITDNPFREVKQNPLSTFSIDVDTASYANVRRFLTAGQLPPRNAVRIEELLNYFKFSDPAPTGEAPFSANMEVAACPWNAEHWLLRVGLKGKEVQRAERPASNLVFLVDVSGSMADVDKLPLLQSSLKLLVDQLTENDRVTIVTYAGDTGVRMPPTNGLEKAKIKSVIDALQSGGSTHGSAGIVLAYEQARAGFIKQGANRVILCTDGDLNVGITRDEDLVELITKEAKSGVFLTVLGFGTGNLKDSKMEKLADHGNGMYAYIDSLREGRKVLVEQMSGSLVTIAKDVKIQIEFNPAQIGSYRLLGYENRMLAAKDFNDDKKDAGEIGAGHSVTALYELVPVGAKEPVAAVDDLKYQTTKPVETEVAPTSEVPVAWQKELLTLKLRYKQPDGDASKLLTFPLTERKERLSQASADFRFASAVAAFGMLLRQSPYRGEIKLEGIAEIASSSLGEDANGYRTEFLDLVRRAKALSGE